MQVLCEEMAGAFEGRAMTCPPWRQARAMLSKWLPAKVRSTPWPPSLLPSAVPKHALHHFPADFHEPSRAAMQARRMRCRGDITERRQHA
jgi:hypothetical protein